MIKIKESQLFTSNVELLASLFTFLFDLEVLIIDEKIKVKMPTNELLNLVLKQDMDNVLILELDEEEKSALTHKLELFNYKNECTVKLDKDFNFILDKNILFSVL